MSLTTDHEGMSRCDLCRDVRYCYRVLKALKVAGLVEVVEMWVCLTCRYVETIQNDNCRRQMKGVLRDAKRPRNHYPRARTRIT